MRLWSAARRDGRRTAVAGRTGAVLLAAAVSVLAALALTSAAAHASVLEGETGYCTRTAGGGYADRGCILPTAPGTGSYEWTPAAGTRTFGTANGKNSFIESDADAPEVVCKAVSGKLELEGATGLTAAVDFARCLEAEDGCGTEASAGHGGAIETQFTGSLEATASHEVLFNIPSFVLEFGCVPSKARFFINADPTTLKIGETNVPIPPAALERIILEAHARQSEGASEALFKTELEFRSPLEFRTHVPAVTALSPDAGAPGGGTSVTLTGLNFSEVEAGTFGDTPALEYTVESPTQITATAPPGDGQVNVRVTNPAGTSEWGAENQFSYAPVVHGVSPAFGGVAGGTTVTISGENFGEATGVTFGSTPATDWEIVSPEEIRAVSPAGASRAVDIRVEAPSGVSATGRGDGFQYDAVPTVTRLSVKNGPARGGTDVLIGGTGYEHVEEVLFGNVPAGFVRVASDQIEAVAPPHGSETVDLRVVTDGGTSPLATKDRFKYGKPEVTHISPASGPLAGGTVVTVEGGGFATGTGTKIEFKKKPGTSVSCESTTVCTVTSPAGAKLGTVNVLAVVGGGHSGKDPDNVFKYE
jgi:hypothetical protein